MANTGQGLNGNKRAPIQFGQHVNDSIKVSQARTSSERSTQSCPRVGCTLGSGRVTIWPDFGGSGRVGSGQHFRFLSFSLIISWYLNRYESSNTAFELINFLRYLIYNN